MSNMMKSGENALLKDQTGIKLFLIHNTSNQILVETFHLGFFHQRASSDKSAEELALIAFFMNICREAIIVMFWYSYLYIFLFERLHNLHRPFYYKR